MVFSNKVKVITYHHFGFYEIFVVLSDISHKIRSNVRHRQVYMLSSIARTDSMIEIQIKFIFFVT